MFMISNNQLKELIKKSTLARKMAYSPYSHFNVGAALLSQNGAIYTGNSVEVDGKIVTGNGPQAAKQLAEELLKAL